VLDSWGVPIAVKPPFISHVIRRLGHRGIPYRVWVSLADGKAGYRLGTAFYGNHVLSVGSALAEQFNFTHASHAISTKIATSLLTPCFEGLEDVLVRLDGNVVILVQVLELHHIILACRRSTGAAISGS